MQPDQQMASHLHILTLLIGNASQGKYRWPPAAQQASGDGGVETSFALFRRRKISVYGYCRWIGEYDVQHLLSLPLFPPWPLSIHSFADVVSLLALGLMRSG